MIDDIPGMSSLMVFSDPRATPRDKAIAVAVDALSVVGVGVVVKLAGKAAGATGKAGSAARAGVVALGESVGSAREAGKAVRALTPADLGLGENTIVEGTFAINGAKATAYVRYLGKPPEGLGSGLLRARKALGAAAKEEGASILQIETSRVIEETGRLAPILERAGFGVRPNGTMFWEGALK
ncbi:uncharacterized protein SOCE26_001880 [Sorangium cellulosum]|uniref:Uncharacterized protein n=1 Tax=Sorangium cellulosum TaxID=56 RepID=A0A2L0EHM9_SORCE|nr:hypothetical protein [Sorangium cellulosum]AUX38810.1 uncharacterized protein SOCE26_001880 [Sorangium cellulosum]